MENALSREDALRSMTIWAARGSFDENQKGSIEKGKVADFVMLDSDLLVIPVKQILGTQILGTYVCGEIMFRE